MVCSELFTHPVCLWFDRMLLSQLFSIAGDVLLQMKSITRTVAVSAHVVSNKNLSAKLLTSKPPQKLISTMSGQAISSTSHQIVQTTVEHVNTRVNSPFQYSVTSNKYIIIP